MLFHNARIVLADRVTEPAGILIEGIASRAFSTPNQFLQQVIKRSSISPASDFFLVSSTFIYTERPVSTP